MPISGSYFYPGINTPNSSYPSVDMREVALPTGVTNLGKLAVDQTGSLYFIDGDNNRVLVATTSSIESIFTGDVFVSGNIKLGGKVYDTDSNLILSSALGSVIAASGVLEFPLDATPDSAHIVANNSHLILSSSAGSKVTVSGALLICSGSDNSSTILFDEATSNAPMIKRGAKALWGRLGDDSDYCDIVGKNVSADGFVIAAASSQLRISGRLFITSDANNNMRIEGYNTGDFNLLSFGGLTSAFPAVKKSGSALVARLADDSDNTAFSASALVVDEGFSWLGGSRLLTVGDGALSLTDNSTEVKLAFGGDATGSINALNSHLILSSSAGSIIASSGSLKLHQLAQADLPAGSDDLSGSMVWVIDVKVAAIYGPEGWTRIVTGSL